MAKFRMREMPDMQGTGERKLYPVMDHQGNFSFEEVLQWAESYCHVSRSTVEAAVSALSEAVAQWTMQGRSVTIDGLGTFRASIGYARGVTPETIHSTSHHTGGQFRVTGVHFRADRRLLALLNRQDALERSMEPQLLSKVSTTRDERLALLTDYLSHHSYLRVADYMALTGLKRSAASLELRAFEADPLCPVGSEGSASHKVYILC